jgi:hypothetical protein
MMTQTISILEIVALLIDLGAIALMGVVFWMVVDDNSRLTKKPWFVRDGSLHLQAKGHIRTYGGSLLSAVLYLPAIIALMTVTPRNNNPLHYTAVLVVIAILGSLIIKMVNAALYLRQRHNVIEMIEQEVSTQPKQTTNARVIIEADGTGTLVSPVDIEDRHGD